MPLVVSSVICEHISTAFNKVLFFNLSFREETKFHFSFFAKVVT